MKAVRETIAQNQVTAGGTKPESGIWGCWSPRPERPGREYRRGQPTLFDNHGPVASGDTLLSSLD